MNYEHLSEEEKQKTGPADPIVWGLAAYTPFLTLLLCFYPCWNSFHRFGFFGARYRLFLGFGNAVCGILPNLSEEVRWST